ncbi:MAG TPA: MFS transporter [Ktedonobacterales bacterium]|nr:MFS transporter [Ktedonobacterales bacterium]
MSRAGDEAIREEPATSEAFASEAAAPSARPRSLWRNRDYMLLWSGQAISSTGTQVSQFAFPLLVLFLTGSPAQAGLIGAARAVPYIFLSLPVGALIDRWDRKRVMILCDSGRAIALGSIPVIYAILGTVPIAQLYLAALVEGTLYVLFNIAEVACLPRVVPKEQLPAATGQNSASEITSALVGAPLGGALYAVAHLLPFLADAVSYALSVGSLLLIQTPFQGERTTERRNLRAEIGEGLRWLWNQPLIRFMGFLTGGLNFTSGLTLIIIVIAQRQGASAPIIGLVFTIGSVGGVVGSVIGPAIQKRFRFGAVIITACWIQAVAWLFYVFQPNIWLLGVISAVLFVTGPVYNVVQFSYRLALIPDALQGRVNSIFRLLAFGFIPVGQALTGLLLEWLDVGPTVLVFGACLLVLALAASLNAHVRHARPIEEIKAG